MKDSARIRFVKSEDSHGAVSLYSRSGLPAIDRGKNQEDLALKINCLVEKMPTGNFIESSIESFCCDDLRHTMGRNLITLERTVFISDHSTGSPKFGIRLDGRQLSHCPFCGEVFSYSYTYEDLANEIPPNKE